MSLWKTIQILGVFFWAVMTGLLIRDTYFPEESRFAEMPPGFVLDLFLQHRDVPDTLMLYNGDQKRGHALIGVRAQPAAPDQTPVYDFQGSGQIDGEAFGNAEHQMTWRLTSELDDAKKWRKLSLQMIWQPTNPSAGADQGLVANIAWKEGGGPPAFEVRQGGKVIMDLAKATSMLEGGAFPLLNLIGGTKGNGFASRLAQIKAREGLMTLAGKLRKCYVLQMQIMGMYEMKAVFTEAGELARVDLPQDWQLLEPMIHGLGGHVVP